MDISPNANLDEIFRPLENNRTSEMLLGKEKARLRDTQRHASWLRIYAIKLDPGIYVITGGAIKLTRTMQEREHTLVELARMEKVRCFLLDNDIVDMDSFQDFLTCSIQSGTLTGVHLPLGELDAGSDIHFQSWISDFIQVLKIQ